MLIWNEARHALGAPEMDATHREFAALATELARAGSEDFPLLFDIFIDHTRRHFDNESRLMREHRFPAIAEHEGEHQRVLGELARLRTGIDEGRIAFARMYIREGVPAWFATHVATMDAALAGCLARSSMAGNARLPVTE